LNSSYQSKGSDENRPLCSGEFCRFWNYSASAALPRYGLLQDGPHPRDHAAKMGKPDHHGHRQQEENEPVDVVPVERAELERREQKSPPYDDNGETRAKRSRGSSRQQRRRQNCRKKRGKIERHAKGGEDHAEGDSHTDAGQGNQKRRDRPWVQS